MAIQKMLLVCFIIIQALCYHDVGAVNSKNKQSFKRQLIMQRWKWKSFGYRDAAASNRRIINLYARTGKFLEILPNGRMRGTSNANSKDAQLEIQTYGIRYRRFKRAHSETYLAIGKYGKPYTASSPISNTLFEAFLDKNGWIRYQNVKYGWMIAIKKNGRMKKAARPNIRNGNSHKSMQFVTLFADKAPWKKHHQAT